MPDNNYATKQDLADLRIHDLADLRTHVDATRQDLADLRTQVDATKQDLADLRTHVDGRFDQIIETTRDMQTEVLRAFHNWARPAEIKFRSHEERLTLLEERLRDIESGPAKQ